MYNSTLPSTSALDVVVGQRNASVIEEKKKKIRMVHLGLLQVVMIAISTCCVQQ